MIKRTEDYEAKREERKRLIKSFIHGGVFTFCALIIIMNLFWGPTAGFLLKNPLSVVLFKSAYDIDPQMRELGLEMTKPCLDQGGRTQDCVIMTVYENLSKELTYSNTPYNKYVNPDIVWKEKSGDCKALSGLYVKLMVNMGVIAHIGINTEKKHAVAVVEPRNVDYYYVVDLTVPAIFKFDRGYNYWDYYDNIQIIN